jgi:hypothetical protein
MVHGMARRLALLVSTFAMCTFGCSGRTDGESTEDETAVMATPQYLEPATATLREGWGPCSTQCWRSLAVDFERSRFVGEDESGLVSAGVAIERLAELLTLVRSAAFQEALADSVGCGSVSDFSGELTVTWVNGTQDVATATCPDDHPFAVYRRHLVELKNAALGCPMLNTGSDYEAYVASNNGNEPRALCGTGN